MNNQENSQEGGKVDFERTSHVLIITFRNSSFGEWWSYSGPEMNLVKTADVPDHAIEFALARENTVYFYDSPRRRVYDKFKKEDKPSAKWFYTFSSYVEGNEDSDDSDCVFKPAYNIRKYKGYTDPDVKITHVFVVNCCDK